MSKSFDELQESLERLRVRIEVIVSENTFLTKENRELWKTVHEYQDAAAAAERKAG
jgi:regulator of replication initiation timing